jgi:hypothetical protein
MTICNYSGTKAQSLFTLLCTCLFPVYLCASVLCSCLSSNDNFKCKKVLVFSFPSVPLCRCPFAPCIKVPLCPCLFHFPLYRCAYFPVKRFKDLLQAASISSSRAINFPSSLKKARSAWSMPSAEPREPTD